MLLLWGLFTLTAQGVGNKTIRKNNINLGFGLGRGYLKDQNYSPLSYSTGGVVVNAGYRRNINDNLLFLTSVIQFGELNSAVSDYNTSDHYNVNLGLDFWEIYPLMPLKLNSGLADNITLTSISYSMIVKVLLLSTDFIVWTSQAVYPGISLQSMH